MADDPYDPYLGIAVLGEDISAADIWIGLHSGAKAWSTTLAEEPEDEAVREMLEGLGENDQSLLNALKDFPAERWAALCSGVGWTVYGAIAYSWCKDASLDGMLTGWELSGDKPAPTLPLRRALGYINPALLPDTNRLSQLLAIAEDNPVKASILVAAKWKTLEMDIAPDQAAHAAAPLDVFMRRLVKQNS